MQIPHQCGENKAWEMPGDDWDDEEDRHGAVMYINRPLTKAGVFTPSDIATYFRTTGVFARMVSPILIAAAASFFLNPVQGHPGHNHAEEVAQRAAFLFSTEYTSLEHCAEQLEARSAGMVARRLATVKHLRKKRGISKRDFETVLNTDHHSNASVRPNSPEDIIFAGNNSCILQPETTEGPYCGS